MSELRFLHGKLPRAHYHGESDLPAWNKAAVPVTFATEFDEDDELYYNYGQARCCHPYREQNQYDRLLEDQDILWAVLENEHLRATFAPDRGGKLWSLIDKDTNRELLFRNPVDRPCNLAIRNAWTSGGVEWNCGFLGHHPHTCDTLFTARTQDENGEPVLRMYEYERVRNMSYQMDFSLPSGSRVLICHMRIVNGNNTVTPIYWWSNIAVPREEGGRVIVPAHGTFTNFYNTIIKADIPVPDYSKLKSRKPDTATAFDVTYPQNSPVSIDYFWKMDRTDRPFCCQLNRDGYGLFQASTARLRGRKLFVWGQGPGGSRWQEFLSGNGCPGQYVEIQAGLAQSQYESLPMPGNTAWEWVEIYGAMQADPARVHGQWDGAIAEVAGQIDAVMPLNRLQEQLQKGHALAVTPAAEQITFGSGWGCLENLRRASAGIAPLSGHLNWGEPDSQQQPWIELLTKGTMSAGDAATPPVSWMLQREWAEMLEKAALSSPNWLLLCQLGGIAFSEGNIAEAREQFLRSGQLAANPWAVYGLSCCEAMENHADRAAQYALEAVAMLPGHKGLTLYAADKLAAAGQWEGLLELEKTASPEVLALDRFKACLASACIHTGNLERAEKLLWEHGGLEIPDIREGEISITELWFDLEEAKARRDGRPFDRGTAVPPRIFDFRMFATNGDTDN